jgi:thioesterase domain-containing protein
VPSNRSQGGERKQYDVLQLASVELAAQRMQRVSEYEDRAWLNYRPQFYDGKIKFVKAAIPSFVPDNPVAVWAHLAREFEFETVPGSHHEMLSTHAESLASILSRFVEEALAEK